MMEEILRVGKIDRLRKLADVKMRVPRWISSIKEVRTLRRLSTREELIPGNFREEAGILINTGPEGRLYFGQKGNHPCK